MSATADSSCGELSAALQRMRSTVAALYERRARATIGGRRPPLQHRFAPTTPTQDFARSNLLIFIE